MKSLEFSQLGLVGHWKFNEGIGATAKDSSPYKNHGTIDGATWTNDAERRMGLVFDGLDDYVDCGNDASLNITDAITVEAWMKSSSLADSLCLVSKKDTTYSQANGWYLQWQTAENKWGVVGSSGTVGVSNVVSISTGTWYHIVSVVSGTTVSFYQNGIAIGSDTIAAIVANTDDLKIGRLSNDFPSWFNGSIDEVRIYNRALPAAEILAHYSRTKYLFDNQNGG